MNNYDKEYVVKAIETMQETLEEILELVLADTDDEYNNEE